MKNTVCGFCQTKNFPIIQLHCIIKGLLCKGFRIAYYFPMAFFHGLDKFRTIAVIGKFGSICSLS